MTVQEYAESMNYTVQDVLNKCKELGVNVSQKDDLLDDDAIVMLDNTMFSLDEEDDLQIETEEEEIIVDRMMEDNRVNTIAKSDVNKKEKFNKLLDKYPKLDGIHYFEVSADILQGLKEKINGSQIKLNGWGGGTFFFAFEENLIPHNPYLEARYKITVNNNAAESVSIRKMNSLFNAIRNSTQGILTAFMDSQCFTDD